MRREAESVFAHTIYNELTVQADKRLLAAFAGGDGMENGTGGKKDGGTILLEEAKWALGNMPWRSERKSKCMKAPQRRFLCCFALCTLYCAELFLTHM